MKTREKIEAARTRLREAGAGPISLAQIDLMNAALVEIDEVDDDPDAVLPSGEHMGGARMLKIHPWGRAVVALADAILEEEK